MSSGDGPFRVQPKQGAYSCGIKASGQGWVTWDCRGGRLTRRIYILGEGFVGTRMGTEEELPMGDKKDNGAVTLETDKPSGKVKQITEYLKYTFTKDELLVHARELGRTTHEIQRHENQLDAIKKELNAKISSLEAQRNVLSNHVTNGYEMRQVDCEVRFNVPESKKKTVVRLDTEETVQVLPMDGYECQEELDFEKAEAKKTGAEVAAGAPVPEG